MTYIKEENKFEQVYLTYDGISGTATGTKGCTLTSLGNWTITDFNTVYFIDDSGGNIIVTVPDSAEGNLGKTLHVIKPRLILSSNTILIRTVSDQSIAQKTTFYLRSPNDRAELISVPFVANGVAGNKYRVNMIEHSVHEEITISVGGTQLFTDIKDAIDYVNMYADGPRRIKVYPGTYYIDETIEINCPYPITIEGFGSETTHLMASTYLATTPMFNIITKCDFHRMTFLADDGYGLIDDECCLDCTVDSLYFEIDNVIIDGFYKGVEVEGNSEIWLFNSIIKNCQRGVHCIGGSFGISEMTLVDNEIGVYYEVLSSNNSFSLQNTIFDVPTGSIGISFVDNGITPLYNFATGNAFYGSGEYISGLTFLSQEQSDIRYENNTGLSNYQPSCWVWASSNTNTTTLTTLGTYYKANINSANIDALDLIKFSGDSTTQLFTYLPKVSRRCKFLISGDISGSNTNDILSVALYKNGTTKLQDIDIRTVTAGQPYPYSFNALNNVVQGDYFDIRISNLGSSTRTAILKTLMFNIEV
jgi:hypothetical protein